MKKTLTFLLTALLAFSANAQTIPNGDMENWTWSGKQAPFDWDQPTSWSTSNPMTEFVGASVKRYSPAHSGDSAAQLRTLGIFGEIAPAFMVNGSVELNFSTFTADFGKSGTPVSTAYHYLHGFYKFSSTSNDDSAFVTVAYKKWNSMNNKTDTVETAVLLLPQVNSYTEFQVDISSVGTKAVDSIVVIFVSTNPTNLKDGGELIVDDLSLDMINSVNNIQAKPQFSMYPNPAKSEVSISITDNDYLKSINIVDITGKTVLTRTYNNALEAKLEIDELLTGVYFVQVTTNKGITTKKLTVIK